MTSRFLLYIFETCFLHFHLKIQSTLKKQACRHIQNSTHNTDFVKQETRALNSFYNGIVKKQVTY